MKLRNRISIHFLFQFFILFFVSFLVIAGLLVLVVNFITNDELNTNPRKAVIENTPTFITILDDENVSINKKWKKQMKDHQMWLQIINEEGKVIYNVNTPSDLDETYTINELLQIEETKTLEDYTVEFYYDDWIATSYYFLFGYEDIYKEQLQAWYETFSKDGRIDSQRIADLEAQLKPDDASLEIYQNGERIQAIGDEDVKEQEKMDVLSSIHSPGKQKTKAFAYNDEKHHTAWVYRIPNEDYSKESVPFLSSEIKLLFLALFISLAIAILFSIWNGYRYGKPLLIMIRWLEKVEKKYYDDIFSEQEQRKVYKRNGKVKFRYRLYKEVIQSFSAMTAKLAKAETERHRLDQVREEWMAGISHDLRTPLSSIQGYGHMLESNKYNYTSEELTEIGNVIRTKSDYMVDLLNDFSLVFQLKNSAISLKVAPINLGKYTKEVVSTFKQDLMKRAYDFQLEEPEKDVTALVDPRWFERVLDNFITNAVKHNPAHTNIMIKVFHKNGHPTIQIKDDGIGMEQEFLEQLFNRYYRGTSTQERTEGEGLGMSIAKAIIDLHEGNVRVQSEKNKGTVVTIRLQKPAYRLPKPTPLDSEYIQKPINS